MQGKIYVHFAKLLDEYPDEIDKMEGYIGIPLVSTKGVILGHLDVMNERCVDAGIDAFRNKFAHLN